ncbi:small multi-drug export protein [Alkalicoccobacillus murimartini]|uniref:Membrane protein n=1 Tax=Alkalicoccobacillus murimartini TaxID=171685 RepID=A0ABT9YLI0_9BACI|nr:small multi-drug export protein [Alkalicoccobacillus murimartini]MDQ0208715.1 putative membrane protein [Alkalicoccobacillus murimartini]
MVQDFLYQLMEVNTYLQHLGIAAIGAIPFFEAFFGATAGTFLGVPIVSAALSSMIGNWISVMFIILPFGALLTMIRNRRKEKEVEGENGFIQKRANKAKNTFDKYGVAGLALLTPLVASGHIAAFTSLAAGVSKKKVIIWHTISIVVWGVLGAVFGHYVGYEQFIR